MSLETYLKRTVKPNDLPYVKQAIKEWLTQKRQEAQENPHWEEAWTIIDNIYKKLLEETEK